MMYRKLELMTAFLLASPGAFAALANDPIGIYLESLATQVVAEGAQVSMFEESPGRIFAAQLSACEVHQDAVRDEKLSYSRRYDEATKARKCFESATVNLPFLFSARKDLQQIVAVTELTMKSLKEDESTAKNSAEFRGMKFGVGFGISVSGDDAIDQAVIVNGNILVESNKKTQPRLVLEFHNLSKCGGSSMDAKFGCGPFAAVSATSDDIVKGVGFGWMWGWRRSQQSGDDFSVGLGVMVDSGVKGLAKGFDEGNPPPTGETTVRFEEESDVSVMLMFTRSF